MVLVHFLKCDALLPYNLFRANTSSVSSYTHSKCGKMLIITQKLDWEYIVYRCLLYCSFNFSVYLQAMVTKSYKKTKTFPQNQNQAKNKTKNQEHSRL